MARLFSYCVARDYGFAPNPFYGYCTLATCKPVIRKVASIGDFVVGTGSKSLGQQGKLIYAMRISEAMSFDEYWNDPRFQVKKRYGDNIYHSSGKTWRQLDSHHSHEDGTPNEENVATDTGTNRVLVSDSFSYFGSAALEIPQEFRNHDGLDICKQLPGHKSNFPDAFIANFSDYFISLPRGYIGAPVNW